MISSEQWSAFATIPSESWDSLTIPGVQASAWSLRPNWLDALFGENLASLRINYHPEQGVGGGAIVFLTRDCIYQVRVASRLRPGEYYEFNWCFEPRSRGSLFTTSEASGDFDNRAISITRRSDFGQSGQAKAVWMINPQNIRIPVGDGDKNIRIFSGDIDETIDINLVSLATRFKESAQEKQSQTIPWRRLLFWMAQLKNLDPNNFKRLPSALKSFLKVRDVEAQIAQLSMSAIADWQRKGLLPQQLPLIYQADMVSIVESIRLQQRLAVQPNFIASYGNICPIPWLLMNRDPHLLSAADFQAFMILGALRELHGFLESEQAKLLARRPDLQAAMQSPQGQRQIQSDPEYLALMTDPRAAVEAEDLQYVALRKAGNYNPTPRDMMAHSQRLTEDSQVQMAMYQDAIIGALAQYELQKRRAACVPPWKVYTPFLC